MESDDINVGIEKLNEIMGSVNLSENYSNELARKSYLKLMAI